MKEFHTSKEMEELRRKTVEQKKKLEEYKKLIEKKKVEKLAKIAKEEEQKKQEKKEHKKKEIRKAEKEEKYTICSDDVSVEITIVHDKNENVPIYTMKLPKVSEATELLLKEISERIAEETKVSAEEVTDPNKLHELRTKFFNNALRLVKEFLPNEEDKKRRMLSGILVQRMYGFGEIDIILSDDLIEEICINRADQPICVYHKHNGWIKTNVLLENEEQTYNYASAIGRKVGRDINSLNPIMDAHLLTGDRVAATMFPVSSSGNTITFRRFSRSPWTITHLVSKRFGVMSPDMAALLWQAMEFELNILVCGGTASGKTSVLNALCALLPKNQRILSVEDTREFILPEDLNWNWIPMVSREKNSEGHGMITMLDLIVASLRMRPDRIIVGEVRKREQAETMFEAMHTGHSVYTTMHADTVEEMTRRLLEPPIQIPKTELEALHIILVQHRNRQKNIRRTLEIAEVLRGGVSDEELKVNYLYRWRPRTDDFEELENSMRLFEDLNLRTGMTLAEIKKDLKLRKTVLNWLVDKEVYDTDDIGKIMKIYYRDKKEMLEYIDDDLGLDEVLEKI